MPVRHSNHALEDASRRQFEAILPTAWVSRSKHPDYGVDLEIEIFEEDGSATGLSFNVQLKATDIEVKSKKVSLSLDHLAYYDSLDVPTAIVRYYRPDNVFYWTWASNILPDGDADQQSLTVRFDDEDTWFPSTSHQILMALRTIRNLRRNLNLKVYFEVIPHNLDTPSSFMLDRARVKLAEDLAWILPNAPAQSEHLRIWIAPGTECISLSVDGFPPVISSLETYSLPAIQAALLYGLSALLFRVGQKDRSASASRAALINSASTLDRPLAARVCAALADDPLSMVALALLNHLHDPTDLEHLFVAMRLSASDDLNRVQAAENFYLATAALEARRNEPAGAGAAYYNLANICRNSGAPMLAVKYYNCARRSWPDYRQRSYWQREFAGCLFETKHFQISAFLYQLSVQIGDNPVHDYCLGDALLFSGRPAPALEAFESAIRGTSSAPQRAASLVRLWLGQWLLARYGTQPASLTSLGRHTVESIDPQNPAAIAAFRSVLVDIDAYCDVANFNVGIYFSKQFEWGDAWACFMLCCLKYPQDLESWTNASVCALNMQNEEVLLATLTTALNCRGYDAYVHFREKMTENGADDMLIRELDEISRQIISAGNEDTEPFVVRMGAPST
jgi:tetratricopeptide (TPR) repeat protein